MGWRARIGFLDSQALLSFPDRFPCILTALTLCRGLRRCPSCGPSKRFGGTPAASPRDVRRRPHAFGGGTRCPVLPPAIGEATTRSKAASADVMPENAAAILLPVDPAVARPCHIPIRPAVSFTIRPDMRVVEPFIASRHIWLQADDAAGLVGIDVGPRDQRNVGHLL